MWIIGRLKHSRKGSGSIIGIAFLVLILMSGFSFYILNVNANNNYRKTLQTMDELDLKRKQEEITFEEVSVTSSSKLNVTVKNAGSSQSHLIWLGIFNKTATPDTQGYYELDEYVNPAETLTNIGSSNTINEECTYVIQLVTELGNTFSSSYPPSSAYTYDFVDETCDLYAPSAQGTHSFFSAQQAGPDGIQDTLLENNTAGTIKSPTDHEDPGNEWSDETNAYDDDTGTYAVDDVPGGDTWSQYLVLTHDVVSCNKIRYYIGREDTSVDQVEIDIYNGTWTNVYSGAGTWNAWTNVSFAETSVTKMRFRFFNTLPAGPQKRMAYVYEADFLQSESSANYELDLEVRWTGVDNDEANEWLCIYGGTMGSEDILVDVWNGSAWVNIFADLSSGWNSVDVSSYLISSTFVIRFRGSTETGDTTRHSWEIDATFLYVWT